MQPANENFEHAASTTSRFRDCARNQATRRRAFVYRARVLLPHLDAEIETRATELFGPESEHELPLDALANRLDRRAKFYDWFAGGKPAEVEFISGVMPDGEIDPRFARCWQAAVKVTPGLTPHFQLRRDGFRVPLPHGYYRFERRVLLDPATDDGRDLDVSVDPGLLRKGGWYRLHRGADSARLELFAAAIPRWKIALRMLRRYRASLRPEILRRLRSGVAFEFARPHGALRVTLRAGRMPDDVRAQYRQQAATIRRRLDRVREAIAILEQEGQIAAEAFAVEPEIVVAQRTAQRESAIAAFREARDRLWRVARECYRRDSLPPWPFRTPSEIRGCARRGLSSRQRLRLEHAIEWFENTYRDAIACGWNPLDDPTLTEQPNRGVPQRVLALEFVP